MHRLGAFHNISIQIFIVKTRLLYLVSTVLVPFIILEAQSIFFILRDLQSNLYKTRCRILTDLPAGLEMFKLVRRIPEEFTRIGA